MSGVETEVTSLFSGWGLVKPLPQPSILRASEVFQADGGLGAEEGQDGRRFLFQIRKGLEI